MKDHATTIIQLKDQDLELRSRLMKEGQLSEGYNPKMEALHLSNAAKLELIINEIGYPTIDRVGEEASAAAWLIIQHAISRPAFMIKCCTLLKDAVASGQANPDQLAYLTDRIAVFQGKPQQYGTQFDWDNAGQLSPNPYDSLDLVNARRKSLGWNSLEERTKEMRAEAALENHRPPADHAHQKVEYDLWRERVGWLSIT